MRLLTVLEVPRSPIFSDSYTVKRQRDELMWQERFLTDPAINAHVLRLFHACLRVLSCDVIYIFSFCHVRSFLVAVHHAIFPTSARQAVRAAS